MSIVDQARNAAQFIEDETHEARFDELIWMLRQKRDEAAAQVPEWEQLRDLASAIKEHTLSNLAHYLEMFEANAQRNGATVHWARDAHEHNQIVYDILKSKNADTLIKSKSMLTEECDTRAFLKIRGIMVTETDLGELRVNTIGFLAHDIVILLDPKDIVENIHDAYQHPAFRENKYAVLMTGPSGSADIGGKTVHPAQGVKTLTVIIWPLSN